MPVGLENLVDYGERALASGRRGRVITAAIVRGPFSPTAVPVQADAVVACLAGLLAAITRAVRSFVGVFGFPMRRESGGGGLTPGIRTYLMQAGLSSPHLTFRPLHCLPRNQFICPGRTMVSCQCYEGQDSLRAVETQGKYTSWP